MKPLVVILMARTKKKANDSGRTQAIKWIKEAAEALSDFPLNRLTLITKKKCSFMDQVRYQHVLFEDVIKLMTIMKQKKKTS